MSMGSDWALCTALVGCVQSPPAPGGLAAIQKPRSAKDLHIGVAHKRVDEHVYIAELRPCSTLLNFGSTIETFGWPAVALNCRPSRCGFRSPSPTTGRWTEPMGITWQ